MNRNACEAVVSNPQLKGAIDSLVHACYRRNFDLMQDSAFDEDDLSQELMLALCDESVQPEDRYYKRLSFNRLKDIAKRLRRVLTDEDGELVSFVPYDEAFTIEPCEDELCV